MERALNAPPCWRACACGRSCCCWPSRNAARAAAAALNMTQSAASKMLHELEQAIGQPLFERVGRGLALTAAGDCVMGYFRGMRGTVSSLARELEELRLGSAGKLFIGSIMAASPGPLTDALLRLADLSAAGGGDFDGHQRPADRTAERGSAGCGDRPHADAAAARLCVPPHRRRGAVGDRGRRPPLAGRARVSFEALREYPWILQPQGSPMRDVIEQEFRSHDAATPPGLIESASILTTTNLAMKSTMLGVIPESVASRCGPRPAGHPAVPDPARADGVRQHRAARPAAERAGASFRRAAARGGRGGLGRPWSVFRPAMDPGPPAPPPLQLVVFLGLGIR